MCVKFLLRDLNSDPYPPHLTSIYTYGVTIAPRVCGDIREQISKRAKKKERKKEKKRKMYLEILDKQHNSMHFYSTKLPIND